MLCCITKKDIAVCSKEARLAHDTKGPEQNKPAALWLLYSQWTHTALLMFPTKTVVSFLDLVSFVWLCKSSK